MPGRWTCPPEHVPEYDGEMAAIRAVEAVGWTVYWHNTGYGHIANAVAVHPGNPASPMALTFHEYPGPRSRYWWRPMVRVPHVAVAHAPHRIETWMPRRLARLASEESVATG